jgi:probable rRNA maturation factor
MNLRNIHFHTEETDFVLANKTKYKTWLGEIMQEHNYKLRELNYIFCTDEYLLNINREYLDHDYYTDIITFDNSEEEGIIEGDIFVSIDRIKDNAKEFKQEFEKELTRVIAHGLLHLIGFGDKEENEVIEMRKQEDLAIQKLII